MHAHRPSTPRSASMGRSLGRLALLGAFVALACVFRPAPTSGPLPARTPLHDPAPAVLEGANRVPRRLVLPSVAPATARASDLEIPTEPEFPSAPGVALTSRPDELLPLQEGLAYRGRNYLFSADRSGLHADLLLPVLPALRPHLDLALAEVRMGGAEIPLGPASLPHKESGKMLSFDRGSVLERVTCGKSDFEQDVVIVDLPPVRGAITVSERIETKLAAPPEEASGAALRFGTEESGAFEISKAVAIDGAGRKLPLDLRYRGGFLEMTVPEPWVREATLPIVIDPVVGSPFTVYSGLSYQGSEQFAVAYGSTPNEWLVTWFDQISTSSLVYAQRVSATGALSGSRIQVNTGSASFGAAVAYSPATNSYLVVYVNHIASMSTYSLVCRFVSATGTVSPTEIVLASNSYGFNNPSVATDGTNTFYIVAENVTPLAGGYRCLSGFVVSNAGGLIATANPEPSAAPFPQYPKVAYSSPEYMVTWSEGSTMLARGMNASGAFFTPITTVATNASAPTNVSAGGGKFLYSWTNGTMSTTVSGRLAQAGSGSAISFTTGAFAVSNGTMTSYPDTCYSATIGQWCVAHQSNGATVSANLVSPGGTAGADQTVVGSASATLPRTAWNSATNDVLTVYEWFSPSGGPNYINAVRFNLGSPPGIPTNLVAVAGNQSVTLSWTPVTGATGYAVYRSTTSTSFPSNPSFTVSSAGATDTNLTNGTTYYYIVAAMNLFGTGTGSAPVSATPEPPPPPMPTGLVATPGDSQVTLRWNAAAGATGYGVYRSATSGGPYDLLITTQGTTWTDTSDLFNGTPYYYVVTAFNLGGSGPASAEVSCTPVFGGAVPALFVVGNSVTLSNDDTAILNELKNGLGYAVTVHADTGILASDLTGKALAVISSSVNAGNVGSAFSGSTLPLVVSSPAMMQTNLGMASSAGATSGQTTVVMNAANASHPLSAALTGSPSVVTVAETFSWAVPYGTATVIATLSGNTSEATIYAYDPGVAMAPGTTAAAPRVGFFLGSGAGAKLAANGRILFDAAVRYAAGTPAAPLALTVQLEKTRATLEWVGPPGAQSYVVYRATSPNGPFSPIARGVSGTQYVDSTVTLGTTYYYTVAAENAGGIGPQVVPAGGQVAANAAVVDVGGTVSVVPILPGISSPYNSGSLQGYVMKSVAGLVQDLSADGTTLQSGKWSVAGSGLTITSQDSTHCAFNVTTQKEGICGISYIVTLSTGETAAKLYFIKIRYLKSVTVKFHFPEDSPGRTTRGGYGDFWAPDSSSVTPTYFTRYSNRSNWANDFSKAVNAIWQHAGINMQVYVDEKLMGNIGCTGGTFNATDSALKWTSQGAAMFGKYSDELQMVHIFLVQSINGGAFGGLTQSAPFGKGWCVNIFLADYDTTGNILAHELGHALSLPDYKDRLGRDIKGLINNLTLTNAWNPLDKSSFGPLNFLIMKWQSPHGAWVTDVDGWAARAAADTRKINYN